MYFLEEKSHFVSYKHLIALLSAVHCVVLNGICGMRFSALLMGVFIHLCLGYDYTQELA